MKVQLIFDEASNPNEMLYKPRKKKLQAKLSENAESNQGSKYKTEKRTCILTPL